MEKDFHVDCYVCEGCDMQLTDEPNKRCYPLGEHLYCRTCHIKQLGGILPPQELEVGRLSVSHYRNAVNWDSGG